LPGSWHVGPGALVGIELAEEAVRLADPPAARQPTIAVPGHEQAGIQPEPIDLLDEAVEIPMAGTGASLNIAVAGSPAAPARRLSLIRHNRIDPGPTHNSRQKRMG
jgi:hypothetical protein